MEKYEPTKNHPPQETVEHQEGESAVDYLRRLEATDLYVFHGSPEQIAQLEPRDPVTDATEDPNNKLLAIYAYSAAVLSVQRAIIDRKTTTGEWDIIGGTDPENPEIPLLMTTPNINLGAGYVHVLPKDSFKHTDGYQWISESPIKPVATVKVDPETYTILGGLHKTIPLASNK